MSAVLDATIRSSALLVLGLAAAAALRPRPAALRHGVLAASILSAALVVPLSRLVPDWTVPAAAPVIDIQHTWVVSPPATAGPAASTEDSSTLEEWPVRPGYLWAAGCLLALMVLCVRLARLARITRLGCRVAGDPWAPILERVAAGYRLRRRVILVRTSVPGLIATWGVFRPCVLLPPESDRWAADRIHAVLCHELAHVARCDWIVQIAAEIVRAIYWFNPLAAVACSRLRRESEQACDDAVLRTGVPAHRYALHLLHVASTASRETAWAAVRAARCSTLERRIVAMLTPSLDRRPISRRGIAIAAALVLGAAMPIAGLRAQQNTPLPLTGSIYDASGAVLPGVRITLQDAQDFKWETTTDGSGQFDFPPIGPGKYVLEASLMGFRSLRHDLELKTARDWNRAITMSVGDLMETITVSASRTPPSQPPAGPTPVRVGGNIRVPRKLVDVKPVYPPSMREAGLSGVVPIEAIIGTDGEVMWARVRGAHIHPDFAAAALEAVRQWRFTPTLLNGRPVEVAMNVSVRFEIAE